MRKAIVAAATLGFAAPLAAQDVVGSLTGTIDAEEMTYVIVDGDGGSSFERADGDVDVTLVALPDRTPTEDTPRLEVKFTVTGMGPTAEATEAVVRLTTAEGETLSTEGGSSEVSVTAFGLESEDLAVTGNFASQLQSDAGGMAQRAIEGDFQATIRNTPEGTE